MSGLTIALDESILERARSKAARQGTSLDVLVQHYVEAYAGSEESRKQPLRALLDLSRETQAGSGGRRWTRDELHDR